MSVPRLNLNLTNVAVPNIPGYRNNAHPKSMSARGPGQTAARVCYFDMNKGYQTEGHAMTDRSVSVCSVYEVGSAIPDVLSWSKTGATDDCEDVEGSAAW